MLQSFSWKVAKHMRDGRACYLILLLLFIAGMISGILVNSSAPAAQHESLRAQLSQSMETSDEVSHNRGSIFWSSYVNYILLLVLALLSVFYVPGFFVAPLLLLYRGFLLGYGSGALVCACGFSGFLLAIWMQLIPALILLICLVPLCADAVRNGWHTMRAKLTGKGIAPPTRTMQESLSMALICVGLLLFAALWDAYIAPLLLFLLL